MKIHPLLDDPRAVLVCRRRVGDQPTYDEFVDAAIAAMRAAQVSLEGEDVALKPNVTSGENFSDPDSGITTHPAFLAGLIRYLRANGGAGARYDIVEDPHNRDDESPAHWRGTGFIEMAEAEGAYLSTPTRETVVEVTIPDPLAVPTRRISKLCVDPGVVMINVPKLKTHNLGITTVCMKNQQGIVYVLERHFCSQALQEFASEEDISRPRNEWMDDALHVRWQEGLARRLADLAKVAVPRLNVVEGVVGRDGTGFNHGRNFPLGLVVVGTNMVAVDAVSSYLMGFDPQELVYLRIAQQAGLGCSDVSQLHVYVPRDGDIAPCDDLDTMVADPHFEVIRNIKES